MHSAAFNRSTTKVLPSWPVLLFSLLQDQAVLRAMLSSMIILGLCWGSDVWCWLGIFLYICYWSCFPTQKDRRSQAWLCGCSRRDTQTLPRRRMLWPMMLKSGINQARSDYGMTQKKLPDSLGYNTCSSRLGGPRPGWFQKTVFLDISKPNLSKWHQEDDFVYY